LRRIHGERDAEREPPDGVEVLAALQRAAAHRPAAEGAVSMRELLAHLGAAPRSAAARAAGEALARLHAAGAVSCARRHGVPVWSLTASGHARLRRARAGGVLGGGPLPESPQHRAWRRAQTAAALEIDRFRAALRAALADAESALEHDTREPVPSRVWFELSERLRRRAWLVGSASHCLYEWREPDDARADVDDDAGPAGTGRRNIRLWEGPL
jgi:hypothetical protein